MRGSFRCEHLPEWDYAAIMDGIGGRKEEEEHLSMACGPGHHSGNINPCGCRVGTKSGCNGLKMVSSRVLTVHADRLPGFVFDG